MTRRLLFVALLLLAGQALADQILPVTVQTPGGFGQGFAIPPGCVAGTTAFSVKCFATVPDGSMELVGWTGFWWVIGGPVQYVAVQAFHHGGTLHLLDTSCLYGPVLQAGACPAVFYPAGSGHKAVPGDLVWAEFFCAPLGAGARCAAAYTFNFRIPATP